MYLHMCMLPDSKAAGGQRCLPGWISHFIIGKKHGKTPRKPYFCRHNYTAGTMESGSESSFQLLDTNELENTMEGAEEPHWDDTTAPSTPRLALDRTEATFTAGESLGGIYSWC
jgi:hypothetical protein